MSGWVLGLTVGLIVVGIVVVLLVTMIVLASQAAGKAEAILLALDDARVNTGGLWGVDTTNQTATRIVAAAAAARELLENGGTAR